MKSPLQENLYETILDAINAGVWVWNIETGEEWWSDKYYSLLGYTPGEIKPSYNAFLYELVHPADRYLLIDDKHQPIITGIKKPIEIRLKMKDGSYWWFEATGKLVYNEKGEAVKMTGSIIDRNDVKTYQEKLQQTINLTSDQNRKLNNFAHIVSHNLRSHAGNIQGLFSVYETCNTEDEKKECIEKLHKVSFSLNETITNLDEVVKAQTPLFNSKSAILFKDVFDSVIAVLAPDIKNANAIIEDDFTQCKEINYVHAYLESIMLNLLSNAIKYANPMRKPYIKIKTFCSAEGQCYMEVSDNGQGIDLEKFGTKIFGLYNVFHTHPDAKGIGLYITKNQIESLDGSISVKSEPEKGSTFLVQF